VPLILSAFHPIFLGRRKRKPEQISQRGKNSAAHAHSKQRSLENPRRRGSSVGKPLYNPVREGANRPVGAPKLRDFFWQRSAQHIGRQPQSETQHAFAANLFCGRQHAPPVEFLYGKKSGHICDIAQMLPEMLRAVNADEDEFILRGESGNQMRIDVYARLPRKKIFQGKRTGMIAKCELGVKLNQELRARLPENVLAGNLFRLNRSQRDGRFIPQPEHQLRRAQNIRIAHDQIQIAVISQPRIAIATNGEHRAFNHERLYTGLCEAIQKPKHLRRQAQREERLCTLSLPQSLENLRRRGGFAAASKPDREKPEDTVLLRELEQNRPVHGLAELFLHTLQVWIRPSAFEQQRPFRARTPRPDECFLAQAASVANPRRASPAGIGHSPREPSPELSRKQHTSKNQADAAVAIAGAL